MSHTNGIRSFEEIDKIRHFVTVRYAGSNFMTRVTTRFVRREWYVKPKRLLKSEPAQRTVTKYRISTLAHR